MRGRISVLSALLFSFLYVSSVQAQEDKLIKKYFNPNPSKNIIKTNLLGIPLRNYHIEYERVLSKRFSVNLGYRNMPAGKLPLGKTIYDELAQNDPETYNSLIGMKLSNQAFTPEIRFYTGRKGAGRGFYISAFYRNAKHTIKDFTITFEDAQGANQTIDLSGNLKSNTFGLQLGAQWHLGKMVVLDWWIAGPHMGTANALLSGVTSFTLTADDQAEIRRILEDNGAFDQKYVKVDVHAKGANMTASNVPWAGFKTGLCLGIRF